jgi:hypothetical protein
MSDLSQVLEADDIRNGSEWVDALARNQWTVYPGIPIRWFWKHILGNCRRGNTIGWLAPAVGILAVTGPFATDDLFKGLPGFEANFV